MYGFILDFLLLLIFALFIFFGIKNGIIKSLLSFLGTSISFIFSIYMSGIISSFIYFSMIENMVRERLKFIVSGERDAVTIFKDFPRFILNILEFYGITVEKINHIISIEGARSEDKLEQLFSLMIINIFQAFISIILFCIFMSLLWKFIQVVLKICRFPVIREIDKLFGGLFGGLKGYIIIIALVIFIRIAVPCFGDVPEFLSYESINSSVIFKYIYNNNPAYRLFKEISI